MVVTTMMHSSNSSTTRTRSSKFMTWGEAMGWPSSNTKLGDSYAASSLPANDPKVAPRGREVGVPLALAGGAHACKPRSRLIQWTDTATSQNAPFLTRCLSRSKSSSNSDAYVGSPQVCAGSRSKSNDMPPDVANTTSQALSCTHTHMRTGGEWVAKYYRAGYLVMVVARRATRRRMPNGAIEVLRRMR